MTRTIKITATVSVTVGRTVQIYPIATVPAGAASSGAIPVNDGPTNAVIVDAWLGDATLPADKRPRVRVRLDIPGRPNHNRELVLPHTGLDDGITTIADTDVFAEFSRGKETDEKDRLEMGTIQSAITVGTHGTTAFRGASRNERLADLWDRAAALYLKMGQATDATRANEYAQHLRR